MAIDTSIFNQLLRPPKSVAEYDEDALKLQQNRLAVQMQQTQFDDRARAIADGNKLRQVVSGFGSDQAANYNSLLGAGRLDEAQKYQKANADINKTNADVGHVNAQTQETHAKAVNLKMTQVKDLFNTAQTPDQAAQIVKSMYSDPDLAEVFRHSGDTPEAAVGRIPTDPKAFQAWKMQASLGADKLIEYTTPTANTVANNATQVQTTGMNNATSVKTAGISAAASRYSADSSAKTANNRLEYDKTKDSGSEDSALDPLSIRTTAQQYLAGDPSALGNIGRGTQGAKNLTLVRNEIARQANAQGLNGADIAAKMAEFQGMKAGNRTLGTRTANIEVAAAEAAELAPLALAASAKVSRSGLLPFGKAQIMFDTQTNDPDMRQFAMANNALVNAFGQVMSRGGAATVSDKEHARELLSTAFDQPSYAKAVEQLNAEIAAARNAPGKVRKEMSAAASGRDSDHAKPKAGGVVDFGSLK